MLAYQIVFQITSNLQEKYQALDLCLEPLNEGVRKLIMYEEETCTNQRPLEGSPKAEGVADVNTDHSLWILSTQTAVGHVFLSIVLSILLCPLQKFTVPCADKTVACPASNNYLKGSFPSSTPYSQTLTRQECTPPHTSHPQPTAHLLHTDLGKLAILHIIGSAHFPFKATALGHKSKKSAFSYECLISFVNCQCPLVDNHTV